MLTPGLSREAVRVVGEEDSASRVSPLVPAVYASARMIAFAETVCAELMAEHLQDGQTSVGTGFQFTHEAATPLGMKVTMKVRLAEVERRKCVFEVEAFDEVERITSGRHERFVVQRDKFLARLQEKAATRSP
jgi:predicted thioesterase